MSGVCRCRQSLCNRTDDEHKRKIPKQKKRPTAYERAPLHCIDWADFVQCIVYLRHFIQNIEKVIERLDDNNWTIVSLRQRHNLLLCSNVSDDVAHMHHQSLLEIMDLLAK